MVLLAACSQTTVNDTPLTPLDFGSAGGDIGNGLAANSSWVYVVGYTTGSLDGVNKGSNDAFLRKYDGGVVWAQQFGTRSSDVARKVAVDAAGNSYVVGYTAGALGFKMGSQDTFLRKYNSSGVVQWTRQFGTTGLDDGTDVALDASNNVYVLSDDAGINGFVIRKFNGSGVLLTTRTVNSTALTSLFPIALAIDSTCAVVVLAEWLDAVGGTSRNIRIFKYTNTLTNVWNKPFQQTPNEELAYDIATFGTDIYVTAKIDSTASGHGGLYGKLDSAGTLITVKQLEPTSTCNCSYPRSITLDSSGNIYIAGHAPVAFTGFTNAGSFDIVVFKYSPTHTRSWVRQFGQGTFGTIEADLATAIAVSDAVYVTGSTSGNFFGDPSHGGIDAYMAQLDKTTGAVMGIDQ